MENSAPTSPKDTQRRFGCLQVLGMLGLAVIITAVLSAWWGKHYLYASPFEPTQLSAREQKTLESKLAVLENAAAKDPSFRRGRKDRYSLDRFTPEGRLEPEPYSEEGARRDVAFTERELNALIASDPETARRVAIDLEDELLSLKLVVPVEPEFPVFGGKTLRLSMGVNLAYRNGRPVVALKGVSLGGVPLPNAWLGNLKNVNLVEEFGSDEGFWSLFAAGVEDLSVESGRLRIRLKE